MLDDTMTVYTLLYVLFALCIIFPPTEFVSSGLTVNMLLSSAGLLGSEDLNFVGYQTRRTAATLFIHSTLPLGYFIGLRLLATELVPFFDIFLLVSIALTSVIFFIVATWRMDNWRRHPLSKTLALYSNSNSNLNFNLSDWIHVAASVNDEFRRIDKFVSNENQSSINRVIVTDSWLISVSIYSIDLIHQAEVKLSMTNSRSVDTSHSFNYSADRIDRHQLLTINVQSNDVTRAHRIKPFNIRLRSMEYADFKDKLRAPVMNARQIIVHLTLSDRFVAAFKAQVLQNPRYIYTGNQNQRQNDNHLEPEIEPNIFTDNCIGCMQVPSNVKLQRLCVPPSAPLNDNPNGHDCRPCYCRPMWCVDCMGKWFASRQDQEQPATWLAGSSPCPTCRATFCMLDVCLLQRNQ